MSPDTEQRSRTDAIIRKLHARIKGVLARNWHDEAEDKAQDAYVVWLEKFSEVQDEGNLVPLLHGIKRKILISAASRGRKPDQPPPVMGMDAFLDNRANPEELAAKREKVQRLHAAIRQLGGRCLELLKLRLQEVETPEIVRLLGITANNVFVSEKRCHDRLREIMLASTSSRGNQNA
ncbi:hypothetical protein SBA3_110006 [Candidatus Sulfopaludibacter sp. SbA3]|nr:hypothetical protein SBA3_110006 [Candidatus Sulfopaludibacter sp. SbA3]